MPNDALKELLGYRSELLGFIRAILRNPSEAEDLFQETRRIILEKSPEAAPILDFRAWAKEIARRQVLRHYRTLRTRRTATVPSEEMAELVSDVYLKYSPTREGLAEESAALRACMDEIPREAGPGDSDGDGLTDSFEGTAGLDPYNAYTKASGVPDEVALDPGGRTYFEVQAGSTRRKSTGTGGGGCGLTGLEGFLLLVLAASARGFKSR